MSDKQTGSDIVSGFNYNWINDNEYTNHGYKWITSFVGDWQAELDIIKTNSVVRTNMDRSKDDDYPQEHVTFEYEENSLLVGVDPYHIMYREYWNYVETFEAIFQKLGLNPTWHSFHIQHPGEMLHLHVDTILLDKKYTKHENHKDMARFFIFLEDWKPGQFMQMGSDFIKWKKGDVLWFDWKTVPHASGNSGWEPKCLAMITGIPTARTLEIIDGKHPTIII